jgi:hypothetical protein
LGVVHVVPRVMWGRASIIRRVCRIQVRGINKTLEE